MKRVIIKSNSSKLLLLLVTTSVLAVVGCGPTEQALPEKAPRPVCFFTLREGAPTGDYMASGAVKSWKTEQIGFEVSGRVEWVLEPGEDIQRRIAGPDGEWFSKGTALAKIDPAHYQIALETAEAEAEVAAANVESITVRLKQSLPADRDVANSDLDLATAEEKRITELKNKNAASRSELDQATNRLQTVNAKILSLIAAEKQTQGELKAAEAKVTSALQTVKDAKRDLANTTLFASYRGQISDVHVVPGSVVSAGSPVLTLKMMDPIKIEVELSAEKSQQFRRRRQVPVSFKLPDGTLREDMALVYSVATSADPATRTFSLTLLLMNEKLHGPMPPETGTSAVARTEDLWPLFLNRIIGAPDDMYFVEEKSIIEDDDGHYVYQVDNTKIGATFPELLMVKRRAVTVRDLRIPFLGIWTFREVEFTDASGLNPQTLMAGELKVEGGTAADWQGNMVSLDFGSQWMLRPGDLVEVNLSADDAESGYYVPINAIYEESGTTSLFVAEGGLARRISVDAIMPKTLTGGSLVRVQSPELADGLEIVVDGVHFLSDGDRVLPIGPAKAQFGGLE